MGRTPTRFAGICSSAVATSGARMRSNRGAPFRRGGHDRGPPPQTRVVGASSELSSRRGNSRQSRHLSGADGSDINSPAQPRRSQQPRTLSATDALLHVLAASALWLCLQPAAGQPLGNSISPTSVVSTSAFFASSLAAPPPYNTLLIIRGAHLMTATLPVPLSLFTRRAAWHSCTSPAAGSHGVTDTKGDRRSEYVVTEGDAD